MTETAILYIVAYVFIGLVMFFATLMKLPDSTKLGCLSSLLALTACVVCWPALLLAGLLVGDKKP